MSSLQNAEVIIQLQKEIAQLKKLNRHYPPTRYESLALVNPETIRNNARYHNTNKANQSMSTYGNKQLVQKILNSSSSKHRNKPLSHRTQSDEILNDQMNYSAKQSQTYWNQKNNSFDLQINSLDEESSDGLQKNSFLNNNVKARNASGLSIDLNRFKIGQDDLSSSGIKTSLSKNKENELNEELNDLSPNALAINNMNQSVAIPNISNMNNNNKLHSMPSTLSTTKARKSIREDELVANISVSASNYKFIMYTKQMQEEANKKKNIDFTPIASTNQSNPSLSEYKKLFSQPYKANSRRMIVEMSKVLLKSKGQNESLSTILSTNKIQMIVLSSMETIDQNEQKQTKYNRGSNITLGELPELNKNKEQQTGYFFPKANQAEDVKYLDKFLNKMDDESEEKTLLLNFLVIPRVMMMVVNTDRYPFLFVLTPSNMSCSFGIEDYLFKWKDCRTFSVVGWFDMVNLKTCTLNNSIRNEFEIVVKNDNDTSAFYIEANNEETAKQYVNSINYVSQLIKCRAFYSKNSNKQKKY